MAVSVRISRLVTKQEYAGEHFGCSIIVECLHDFGVDAN